MYGLDSSTILKNKFDDIQPTVLQKFEQDDQLPKQMCKNCIEMTHQTYDFLYKCKSSEQILRSILLQDPNTSESEETILVLIEPKNESNNDININCYNENNDADDLKIVENQWDNISLSDADVKIESKFSESEDTTNNQSNSSENNLIDKINNTKQQISKIWEKNKARLRKMAKAQLVDYRKLPRNNKRPYVFNKDPPYICITCDSPYPSYEELKRHKIEANHKTSLKHKCEHCGKKYARYCNFVEHVRTHTGEKPNKCSTCGRCFNAKNDLKRHMNTHLKVKPHICSFCDKGFTRRQYLIDHERKHTGEELICPYCGKGFHSYPTLYKHEKIHKGPAGFTNGSFQKRYQCHICQKVLFSEQTLKEHVLLHGPKNFSCEKCGKTYISENRLQDHIKMTHQETKYTCNLCKKEYKQKATLIMHMKSHSGENHYPCDICGKQFASKKSRFQHKRIHTGDTKYQCKECFHISTNKRNLENHLRTHTGEKPFACKYCGKLFSQKTNMNAHLKIHTGERNHLCQLCDKAFYNPRGLKKHMAVHEKNGQSLGVPME